ncbi:hypothetical protein ID852_08635 [Xenorhabdus sp. 42]|nr:hypothetical protein [Xenorhabdus sp. 42]MBD2820756.1 hypothetical protein [Xenorhabdus sp. 42]
MAYYFDALNADVVDPDNPEKPSDRGGLQYTIEGQSSPGIFDLGDGNQGPISFKGNGTGMIKATMIIDDGRIYIYKYYVVTMQKIFYPTDPNLTGYHPRLDNIACESGVTTSRGTPNSLRQWNFFQPNNPYTIYSEFGNIFNWGIFVDAGGQITDVDDNFPTVKVYNMPDINHPNKEYYAIYDVKTNEITNNQDYLAKGGLLICTYGT